MRALITGATGFIGRRLIEQIAEPVVLSRNPASARGVSPRVEAHAWEPLKGPPPVEAFAGVEAVFHLAGEPVGEGRWNDKKKQLILDSRKIGTANLVTTLQQLDERPRVLVSASAIGYYGERGDEVLDESSSPGGDFLAQVCQAWEQAAAPAEKLGVRVANPRIGIVLGAGGGALAKMLFPFKLGLGGRLASGRQWMSWVHVDDVVGILLHAAERDQVRGPINAVAPQPVTNREFTAALGHALHRPTLFPVPGFALRLGFGQFAEVLLASQRVLPRVAERTGYAYRYPTLAAALEEAVAPRGTAA